MQIPSSFHTIAPTRPSGITTESVTMATMKFSARRLIIAGGFAVAVAAAPAIAVFAMPTPAATPLAQCPAGEEPDLYTSVCVPHLVPNAGAPYSGDRRQPRPARGEHLPGGGGAIPCTGHNSGQCIGLAEEAAGRRAAPRCRGRRSAAARRSPAPTAASGSPGGTCDVRVAYMVVSMAAKSDPAELGDVEPLADSTATPGQARRRRLCDRRRRMPDLPVDARHWTGETRGVSESGGRPERSAPATPTSSSWPTGCRSTWNGCPTARRSGSAVPAAWSPRSSRCCAAGEGAWIGWPGIPGQRRRPDRRGRSAAVPGAAVGRRRRDVLRGLLERRRCGRCTTTSSSSRSTTASGGTATSTSTGASPRPPRGPRRRARRCGSRTTSCSWCRRCCGCCGPISPSDSSCTFRSRRWSCSCRCRGGPRSSKACSAPTWSASTCPAARRTS